MLKNCDFGIAIEPRLRVKVVDRNDDQTETLERRTMKITLKTLCLIATLIATSNGQDTALERARAAADLLPDGPQKDAVLAALNPPTGQISFLDKIGVDRNGEWATAELKKAQVAEIFAGQTHIPLTDGRKIAVSAVTSLTPSGLRWIGDGISEAHWSLLPESLVNAVGFTREREAAYTNWKQAANLTAARQIAAVKSDLAAKDRASVNLVARKEEILKSRVAVSLRVSQALEHGALCYGARIENNPYWGHWEGLRWVTGLTVADEHNDPIFVVGLPIETVDGSTTAGYLYPCGIYRYTTVAGAEKTVRKYATTPERVLEETQPPSAP